VALVFFLYSYALLEGISLTPCSPVLCYGAKMGHLTSSCPVTTLCPLCQGCPEMELE
jgi:hypothetical protein